MKVKVCDILLYDWTHFDIPSLDRDANTYHSIPNDLHKEPMKLKKLMVNKRNFRGKFVHITT